MKKFLQLFLSIGLIVILTGCSVTHQSYSFAHHGTDMLRTDSNWKYVARNVMGKAKTTIKLKAWKKMEQSMVTDGLLATAKSRLPELSDNQGFANMSIDQLVTTQGTPTSTGGIIVEEMTIEVVVSADIIEYY
tara:strand:- start:736 stop:1134 length:399 start_codon:yes stop_codon:yes gene_type:complete